MRPFYNIARELLTALQSAGTHPDLCAQAQEELDDRSRWATQGELMAAINKHASAEVHFDDDTLVIRAADHTLVEAWVRIEPTENAA